MDASFIEQVAGSRVDAQSFRDRRREAYDDDICMSDEAADSFSSDIVVLEIQVMYTFSSP